MVEGAEVDGRSAREDEEEKGEDKGEHHESVDQWANEDIEWGHVWLLLFWFGAKTASSLQLLNHSHRPLQHLP